MDLKLLGEAFDTFTRASRNLESCYNELREKLRALTEELHRKNQELQDALREVEKNRDFLQAIIHALEESVIVIDPEERIIMLNHSAEELFGISAETATGKYLSDLDFTIYHEGADAILKAGGKRRNILISNAPVISNGVLVGEVILIRDITRLKELEIQYERNQRLIAMGEMAARLVHEIRNPLCSIELFATTLEKEAITEKGKELSRGISAGIRTLNNILTNMLIFARPGRPNLRPVSAFELIKGTIDVLWPIQDANNINVEFSGDDCIIMADKELLCQAFLNIMINAIQAMRDGGTLRISITQNAEYTHISFTDTGHGIAPEIVDRIFDPFFTTKDNGTGLGLAITAKIVQAHGGFINVESESGKGTTFIVSIPSSNGLVAVTHKVLQHGGELSFSPVNPRIL